MLCCQFFGNSHIRRAPSHLWLSDVWQQEAVDEFLTTEKSLISGLLWSGHCVAAAAGRWQTLLQYWGRVCVCIYVFFSLALCVYTFRRVLSALMHVFKWIKMAHLPGSIAALLGINIFNHKPNAITSQGTTALKCLNTDQNKNMLIPVTPVTDLGFK